MKITTLALSAIFLSQLAAAQPRRHAHRHLKRDVDAVVTETIVDTVYAQATGPNVVVLVNQDGVPLSTVTDGMIGDEIKLWSTAFGPRPTPVAEAPAPAAPATTFATVPVPTTTVQIQEVSPATSSAVAPVVQAPVAAPEVQIQVASSPVPVVEAPAPAAPSPTPVVAPAPVVVVPTVAVPAPVTSAIAPAPVDSSSGSGYGFSYSPYHANHACKTKQEVSDDFDKIQSGFSVVRTYGVDCDQTATVLAAAKSKGLKLFAGIYDVGDIAGSVNTIKAAAAGDWSHFDGISIGNEIVNGGGSAAQVIAAIGTARGLLRAAGFNGPVGTVDTLVAARANPGLCDASDRCTVNCHPFFDGQVTAEKSGDFLETQIGTLRDVLANKNQKIIISESGWPWQGQSNGVAVPSKENQAAAVSSIKATFASNPSGVILFTAFNDYWKTNTKAQFGAEQFWGFMGDSAN